MAVLSDESGQVSNAPESAAIAGQLLMSCDVRYVTEIFKS